MDDVVKSGELKEWRWPPEIADIIGGYGWNYRHIAPPLSTQHPQLNNDSQRWTVVNVVMKTLLLIFDWTPVRILNLQLVAEKWMQEL